MTVDVIEVVVRLVVGAVSTFLAILLWAKTRDTAWMLVIMGVIVAYGEIIYSTLKIFGVVPADVFLWEGLIRVDLVLSNLPLIFIGLGVLVMLMRRGV